MTSQSRFPFSTAVLLAMAVGVFTLTCTARAISTHTTADSSSTSFNLVAGASTKPITPPASQAVLVMGCCNSVGFRGTGHVSLLHVPSNFLEWVGIDSTSGAGITSGFSAAAGVHICRIDFSGGVNINVRSADTFVVTNSSGGTRAGVVKMIW